MKNKLVLKSIWVVIAIALWVTGLVVFINYPEGEGFIGYCIWGALCSVCTIRAILLGAKREGRKGSARGANDFSVTDNGAYYTIRNHPLRGAIFGFVGGFIGGVLGGPIVVPLDIVRNLIDIVKIAIKIIYTKSERETKSCKDSK